MYNVQYTNVSAALIKFNIWDCHTKFIVLISYYANNVLCSLLIAYINK